MKTKRDRPKEDGSVLVVAIVFLSIAGFSIGSIMSGTSNFLRMNRVMHNHERAFLLADAGLAAALVDLNNGGDGIITRSDSRNYFSRTNHFTEAGWGFETSTSDLSGGALRISSEGTCRDSTAQCQVNASEDVGEDTIHCLYSMAVYAGNSSNSTNYLFALGGSGSRADFVHGDIHCNGDIEILGDATVRLPEEYTD